MEKTARKLKKLLANAGWEKLRHGKGDHEVWINRGSGMKATIDNGSTSRHLANAILKQAGLPKAF